MVDVSDKAATAARGDRRGPRRRCSRQTLATDPRRQCATKGDVLGAARIAGIMAAKRTAELIPLCHPLLLAKVAVDARRRSRRCPAVAVTATVASHGPDRRRDGGADRGLGRVPDLYDMLKAVDRGMRIDDIRLVAKAGGKSGDYRARAEHGAAAGRRGAGPRSSPASSRCPPRRAARRGRRPGAGARTSRRRRDPAALRPPRRWTAMPCAPPMSPARRRARR